MCRKDAKKGACLSVVGTGGGRDVGSQRSSPLSCAGAPDEIRVLMLTAALSLGSAVALGLARFSYALLLPAMQRDLGWSFATAGTMNTANALGYLLGALAFPRLSRRWTPCALFRFGCIATATTVALSSVVANTESLLMLRVASGVGSALIFVGGGVLAARLASMSHRASGLILGLYYGGIGWGIVASSILVPLAIRPIVHGWQFAWFALASACIAFSVIAIAAARRIESGYMTPGSASKSYGASGESLQWRRLGFALSRLWALRCWLYRLHDLHRCATSQRGHECRDGEQFLHSSRRGDRVVSPFMVRAACSHARRSGFGHIQCTVGVCDAHTRAHRA